jgi:DNA-binding transcriptional LysR family regulator
MVIVAHPNNPFAQLPALNDKQLCQLRWIMREPGSGTRQAFDHAMRGLLGDINVHLELQYTEAIKQSVKANLGVACLSRLSVKEDLEQGRLVCLPAPHRDWQRQLYIIHLKEKPMNYSMNSWLEVCARYQDEMTQ